MKENFIVANAHILDKFDLPIQEDIKDNSSYTIDELKLESTFKPDEFVPVKGCITDYWHYNRRQNTEENSDD
jgi:hypothetical protein